MDLRALFPFVLLVTPALAGETPWQEVAPGVKLRLIADATAAADGTTRAALEVDMPQSMHSYWRVPGESGIPTLFDFAGSTGVGAATPLWPYPNIEQQAGMTDFVYYGPMVLPVSLATTGASGELRASVRMGVCSEVCMPVSASFVLPVDFAQPDQPQGLRIAQAVAQTPLEWNDVAPAVGAVRYDEGADALAVEGIDARIDPASLIADLGPAGQLFGAPQKSRDGTAVSLPLLGGKGEAITGRDVTLTFMTAGGPYWVSVPIASGGSTGANP